MFKYECRMGHLLVLSWDLGTTSCSGECCFGMMYVEYFVLCVVYGVGIYLDVCDVVCVVECCLFLESGRCLLCCYVVKSVFGGV